MLGNFIRELGNKVLRFANEYLTRAGFNPNWIYLLSITSALACSTAFLNNYLWVGLFMLVIHGLFDYLDGGLRRMSKEFDQRPRWLGVEIHPLVDKISEIIIFAGLIGGKWVGWPLGLAALTSSLAVTIVGILAKRWLDITPGRVLFDRSDRLLVILVTGAFRAFYIGLIIVCIMNGIILLQRLSYILQSIRVRNGTA